MSMRILRRATAALLLASTPALADGPAFTRAGGIAAPGPNPGYSITPGGTATFQGAETAAFHVGNFGPLLDPRLAGAKCDGKTDDAPAFRQTAAIAVLAGYGTILVPGQCVIRSPITVTSMPGSIGFEGFGSGTLLTYGNDGIDLLYPAGGAGFGQFSLDGFNMKAMASGGRAIYAETHAGGSTDGNTIHNVHVLTSGPIGDGDGTAAFANGIVSYSTAYTLTDSSVAFLAGQAGTDPTQHNALLIEGPSSTNGTTDPNGGGQTVFGLQTYNAFASAQVTGLVQYVVTKNLNAGQGTWAVYVGPGAVAPEEYEFDSVHCNNESAGCFNLTGGPAYVQITNGTGYAFGASTPAGWRFLYGKVTEGYLAQNYVTAFEGLNGSPIQFMPGSDGIQMSTNAILGDNDNGSLFASAQTCADFSQVTPNTVSFVGNRCFGVRDVVPPAGDTLSTLAPDDMQLISQDTATGASARISLDLGSTAANAWSGITFDSGRNGTHVLKFDLAGSGNDLATLQYLTTGQSWRFDDDAGFEIDGLQNGQSAFKIGTPPAGVIGGIVANYPAGYPNYLLDLLVGGAQALQVMSDGSIVDTGSVTSTNVTANGGYYYPTTNGNQPVATTDPDGAVHFHPNKGAPGGGIVVDGKVLVNGFIYAGSFATANLPAGCTPGEMAVDNDGRKNAYGSTAAEAAHGGSGVPVMCLYTAQGTSTTAWFAMQVAPVAN